MTDTTTNRNTIPDGMPVPGRYWAILAIGLGIMVAVLDGSIANVALPTIASDLHTSSSKSIWVVNAYQLAITVSLLSLSSIGEIWGYRRVYTWGLLLFVFTSLGCALSDSMLTLTTARTLQGFGAAAITSVNTALIRIIYPARSLSTGMGINALVVAVSAAAGPTIAAGILSVANWPWLFAVNIPVGLIALFLSYKYLPDNPIKAVNRKFDIPSAIMNVFTFGLFIALIEGFTHKWGATLIICVFIGFLVIGFVYIRRELKLKNPMFPVDLLRIPIFRLSIATSIISFMAQMLALVSLPFLLQRALGRDAVTTGLLLTPWPLTTMIFAPVAGALVKRINPGLLGGIGLTIFAFGLLLLGLMPARPTDIDIIWRLAVCGCGFGLFQTPNNSTIIASAPPTRSGGASGMLGTARLLGQTTGAALVALMFEAVPGNPTRYALLLACVMAFAGAFVSMLRVHLHLTPTEKNTISEDTL
ncbi:MAG: MFS transporter [Coprobacter sp.]|nr:MFS transporter [Coprobacter sp.]